MLAYLLSSNVARIVYSCGSFHEIPVCLHETLALIALAGKLRLRQIVVATALVYFRRFYAK
jgi:hypothetical protein